MQASRPLRLYGLANQLAAETPGFFKTKGQGMGNVATNEFLRGLQALAADEFGADVSEQRICGDNSLAVDFYFRDEATIVEIALGLRNPNTEYEKDILKAVMAKALGSPVTDLLFISKPGGERKCRQPGRLAVREWLRRAHGVTITVRDLATA